MIYKKGGQFVDENLKNENERLNHPPFKLVKMANRPQIYQLELIMSLFDFALVV